MVAKQETPDDGEVREAVWKVSLHVCTYMHVCNMQHACVQCVTCMCVMCNMHVHNTWICEREDMSVYICVGGSMSMLSAWQLP